MLKFYIFKSYFASCCQSKLSTSFLYSLKILFPYPKLIYLCSMNILKELEKKGDKSDDENEKEQKKPEDEEEVEGEEYDEELEEVK